MENPMFKKGKKVLNDFNTFYKKAVEEDDSTFFSASGDSGSVLGDENHKAYPFKLFSIRFDSCLFL